MTKYLQDDDSEGDSSDEEGETLGEEAIDLATALDQWEEDSEPEPKQGSESGSDGSASDSASGSDDDSDSGDGGGSESDEDNDDDVDPERLESLRGLVSGFGGEGEDSKKLKSSAKQKIDLADLGLTGLDDPHIKNSVKLMRKEDKENRPGASKKLDIPLSRREQGRNDRSVAYEQTNKTLDRWTETVKQNRRADHLMFPLPHTSGTHGLDNTEIQPLQSKNATNELESTIMSLMDQSGLSMEKPQKKKEPVYDEEGNELTRKEILNRKRLERELNDRESKRAARIKKIKSKAYHRVHRKQKERNDAAQRSEMEEAGEIDSEEEREAQDRRRALERVGQRHKDSKWAKMGSKTKRAVWDDDYRAGLADMAKRDEELRRRKEGKRAVDSDDETSSSGSDSDEDGDAALARKLEQIRDTEDEPQSKLMAMKFMRNAEAARRKENDQFIEETLRELRGEDGQDDAEAITEVGRRQYGGGQNALKPALDTSSRKPRRETEEDIKADGAPTSASLGEASSNNAWSVPQVSAPSTAATTEGAWSSAPSSRKKKGHSSSKVEDLDVGASAMIATRAKQPNPKKQSAAAANGRHHAADEDRDSDDDMDEHMPMAIRDQKLLEKAFAGDDTFEEFEREKEEEAEADDDKVVDNTMPGWGSWVGEGVSKRELDRHKGRFLTKVEGIKKKNRQDAKLDRVIINEKQNKKVSSLFLSPDLPSSPREEDGDDEAMNEFLQWGTYANVPRLEQPLHGLPAAPSLRVERAVRAFTAAARRPRVADQGDVPEQHQASRDCQAGHRHCAHVEAESIKIGTRQ